MSVSRVSATSFRFAGFLWHHSVAQAGQDRSAWSDSKWKSHLSNPVHEYYASYCGGEPAGCCEITRASRVMLSKRGVAQIAGFGLVSVFEGEGLKRDMLTRLAEKAFVTGAARIRISPPGDIRIHYLNCSSLWVSRSSVDDVWLDYLTVQACCDLRA